MALPFLHKANIGEKQAIGSSVLVIGGGDVAMDVARTAVRLGAAQVKTICLEFRDQMPAHEWEVEEALDEGVVLINGYGPVEILSCDDQITGLKAQKVKSVFDREGRFSPVFQPGEFLIIPCDTVIQAVGQAPDNSFLNGSGLAVNSRGGIVTDKDTMTTSVPGVFTCGEIVNGPGPAIAAVASGHRVAELVNSFLSGAPAACPEIIEIIGPLPAKVIKLIPVQSRRKMPASARGQKTIFCLELGFDESQPCMKPAVVSAAGWERRWTRMCRLPDLPEGLPLRRRLSVSAGIPRRMPACGVCCFCP